MAEGPVEMMYRDARAFRIGEELREIRGSKIAMLSGTTGDPDLWGHVRFGQDMLSQGTVRVADTYSFTADRTWINHEWLAEVAMYLGWAVGGTPGLVALKALIVLAAFLLATLVELAPADPLPSVDDGLLDRQG